MIRAYDEALIYLCDVKREGSSQSEWEGKGAGGERFGLDSAGGGAFVVTGSVRNLIHSLHPIREKKKKRTRKISTVLIFVICFLKGSNITCVVFCCCCFVFSCIYQCPLWCVSLHRRPERRLGHFLLAFYYPPTPVDKVRRTPP